MPQTLPPVAVSPETALWSPPGPHGLQLGVWRESDGPQVYGLIRDLGSEAVHFNPFHLGYWEEKHVWARPVGTGIWTKLQRDPTVMRMHSGLGPGKNVFLLQPGHKILWWNGSIQKDRQALAAWGYTSVPYLANPSPPTQIVYQGSTPFPASQMPIMADRIDLDKPEISDESCSVDLADFVWPASWNGSVEMYLEQTMCVDNAEKPLPASQRNTFVLRSAVLTVPLNNIRGHSNPFVLRTTPTPRWYPAPTPQATFTPSPDAAQVDPHYL